jgi:hypothetical protein
MARLWGGFPKPQAFTGAMSVVLLRGGDSVFFRRFTPRWREINVGQSWRHYLSPTHRTRVPVAKSVFLRQVHGPANDTDWIKHRAYPCSREGRKGKSLRSSGISYRRVHGACERPGMAGSRYSVRGGLERSTARTPMQRVAPASGSPSPSRS